MLDVRRVPAEIDTKWGASSNPIGYKCPARYIRSASGLARRPNRRKETYVFGRQAGVTFLVYVGPCPVHEHSGNVFASVIESTTPVRVYIVISLHWLYVLHRRPVMSQARQIFPSSKRRNVMANVNLTLRAQISHS